MRYGLGGAACAAAMAMTPAIAAAEEARGLAVGAVYNLDLMGAVDGAPSRGRVLDKLMIDVDLDFDVLWGWSGGRAHFGLMNSTGAEPNADIGALQGVNNIEVERHRGRLYEAWLEQDLGADASLRIGLYDLNSEFYVTDSSGLLIGPGFGIGSELAATGVNGPSIFPSTALGARFQWSPTETSYVRLAVIGARAGVPGDPGGVDTRFGDGALAIVETGWTGRGQVSVGYWRYTDAADDLVDTGAGGAPLRRTAQGAYVLVEQPIGRPADGAPRATAFARLGVSDGRTGPFKGGWQAGVLIDQPLAGRPNSALSFGVSQGWVSDAWRDLSAAGGAPLDRTETQVELTFSDELAPGLFIQPDLQLILDPGAEPGRDPVVVLGLRLTYQLSL